VTGRLGKRYARALLDLAREQDQLQPTAEQLASLVRTFREPRLQPLLVNPAIEPTVRLSACKAVATAVGVSATVGSLLALLAERNRLAILPDLARCYEAMLDDELDRARVLIRSATPLSGNEKNEVVELARRLTGRREVIAATEVDAALLGGVVLDVASTVYDGSLRTQLARLGQEMAEGTT
jgi:F-type H+-transporting ATPase subunit delta